ncbi:MAG: DUF1127 domain-containing protein [Sulfitobacter sp.]
MTTLTQTTCPPRAPRSQTLVQIITRAYRLWCTRRALAALGPEQLKDVGVSRAEANREAQRAVWDVPANWRA